MEVIGIVGGIASGKSTVAAELAALGAVVLDADRATHDALRRPEVKQALVDRWGESIISPSGEPDRQAIAERVFSSAVAENRELEFLENLLHPLVRHNFGDKLCKLDESETLAAVIDAPLLLEAGWEDLCDYILFVDSSDQNRAEWISPRNWSSGEISRREAAQMPIDEKRQRATHVIRNLGSLKDLKVEVQAFWDRNIPVGP
jgi:dephospho-CoA kinase